MSYANDGGPAFPRSGANWTGKENQAMGNDACLGMTLRDYFAAKAMQGMQSNIGANKWDVDKFAENAYKMADAMLKAREAC